MSAERMERAMNNPPDCNCEHVHCSSPTCRSSFVSRGAVLEKDRIYPSAQGRAEKFFERKFAGLNYSHVGRKELAIDLAIAFAAEEVRMERELAKEYIELQQQLLACYRLCKRPSGKLLDRLKQVRSEWELARDGRE